MEMTGGGVIAGMAREGRAGVGGVDGNEIVLQIFYFLPSLAAGTRQDGVLEGAGGGWLFFILGVAMGKGSLSGVSCIRMSHGRSAGVVSIDHTHKKIMIYCTRKFNEIHTHDELTNQSFPRSFTFPPKFVCSSKRV